MASPAQQLENERWRAQGHANQRIEGSQAAAVEQLTALLAVTSKQAEAIAAINSRLGTMETAAAAHPLRQLWTAFLVGDWRAKLALLAPPLLLAYALAIGQSLPALAGDILTTARVCATGRPEPIHGP
jgi:hypothetical protein